MFEKINDYKITVDDLKNNGLLYIPNVISIHPLDSLFKATEWLFIEAVNDHTETHKQIAERRKTRGASKENIDAIDEFNIRLGSRTQGYVNQLCLMEDILIFEYKRMAKLVKLGSRKKIKINVDSDLKVLKERFKPIRTFRNKVIAHTAYTSPKIDKETGESEDNPETVVRSILNLFPQSTHLTLGNNFFSGFSPWRSQLPVITIYNWETEIRPIFEDWKKLFIEKLIYVYKQCPVENKDFRIEGANPYKFQQALKNQ